jgi:molybdate transport system substrate-binding protein
MTTRRLAAGKAVAIVAAFLGLSACSGPNPAAAPAPAPPPTSAGHQHHQHQTAAPAPSGAPGGTVVVHAADELRDTLTQLVPRFEEAFPGVRVAVEYGRGAEHARHIRDGAPVDVFVSADTAGTDLVATGHVRGAPVVVARNPIVIAVPRTAAAEITGVADLSGARVALCAENTPCGRTSRAALHAAAVDLRPASVEPDPAAALTRVRTGIADAALVYRTDVAAVGDDLRAVDFSQANRIADQYTAIRVMTGPNTVGADAFVTFLGSALARRIFADAGLSPA